MAYYYMTTFQCFVRAVQEYMMLSHKAENINMRLFYCHYDAIFIGRGLGIKTTSGCRESQFYSLPFGQALASICTSPQVISTSPKTLLD